MRFSVSGCAEIIAAVAPVESRNETLPAVNGFIRTLIAVAIPKEFMPSARRPKMLPTKEIISMIPALITDGLLPVNSMKNSTKIIPKKLKTLFERSLELPVPNRIEVHSARCIPDTANRCDAPAVLRLPENSDEKYD